MTPGERLALDDAEQEVMQITQAQDDNQSTGIRRPPTIEETETTLEAATIGFEFSGQPSATAEPGASTPPPGTGACCVGETCTVTTHVGCTAMGGSYKGDGTDCDPNPCLPPCSDLPPIGSDPPTHINIVRAISGSCGDIDFSGSLTYDKDLSFSFTTGGCSGVEACVHIVDDEPGDWSGAFTGDCTLDASSIDFDQAGFTGVLERRPSDGQWFFDVGGASMIGALGTCAGCDFELFALITCEEISDPPGVYVFSDSQNGVTIDTTVTVT